MYDDFDLTTDIMQTEDAFPRYELERWFSKPLIDPDLIEAQ